MRTTRMFIAAGAAVALALAAPATASAAPKPVAQQVWSAQVGAPFSLAVSGQRVLVADGGPGVIGQLQPDGSIAPVVTGVPGLAGLAVRGAWMAYGSSVMDDSSEPPVISASGLVVRDPHGATVYADVHAYEVATNPDLGNEYGAPCQAGGVTGGLIDSHVYAVAAYDGAWLVADAGANALFRVTDAGAISTVAVLPPVPLRLTAEAIGMLGLTTCEPGDVFYAEPVPTGVTVDEDGVIYVSTLPGFPGEGASLGAVWRIDPVTGDAEMVASGLSGATGVAASKGRLYVAELFGAGVSAVVPGEKATPFANLPGALSVAAGPNGTIWVGTLDLAGGPGSIVSVASGKVKVQGHVNR